MCLLTHWGWVMHICVSKLTIIDSDNGLSPGRRQAIIWTNAGILLIWPLGTNLRETLFKMQPFSLEKMHLKMSAKWQPFCLGLNELIIVCSNHCGLVTHMAPDIRVNIDSGNGLSHLRCQDITWTNPGWITRRPLGTKFSKTLMTIQYFSFKKRLLKRTKQKTFSNVFSLMKIVVFPFHFTEAHSWRSNWQQVSTSSGNGHFLIQYWLNTLFLRVQLTISKYWSR